jgi:hypothetical protein
VMAYSTHHFVDLGAHRGEALEEALKPKYRFTSIWAIEPSSLAARELHKFRDPRVTVKNWGAWNINMVAKLHSAGSVGASLFPDKKKHWNLHENIQLKDILLFSMRNLQKEMKFFSR